MWSRAGPREKRKLVVEQVCRQEEMLRSTKAVAQVKQGQWLNWEGVEKKKLSCKELWSMEERSIRFLIGATYDVLPTPQNLKLWLNGNLLCSLCSGTASLRHILSGCKVSLSQGRYSWRHYQVLRPLAAGVEDKRRQVNLGGSKVKRGAIQFVQEGEKMQGSLEDACDWEMQVDLGRKLVVPQEIASTNLRPDVLWSRSRMRVCFIELTVPWEDSVVEAYERKKLRYVELGAEAEQRGWKVRICCKVCCLIVEGFGYKWTV